MQPSKRRLCAAQRRRLKGPAMDAYCLKPQELPDLTIETLGPATIDYPERRGKCHFVEDGEKVLVYSDSEILNAAKTSVDSPPMFEKAGPRRKIFFDPKTLKCGIVTCGGLCPGLNDVIRTITLTLAWQYGVKTIFGFKYGYAGLSQQAPAPGFSGRNTPQRRRHPLLVPGTSGPGADG